MKQLHIAILSSNVGHHRGEDCTGGAGIDELKVQLTELLSERIDLSSRPHAVISERHRDLLQKAQTELSQAVALLNPEREEEWVLAVSHLRKTLELLGEATGKVYHDALLDQIFSKFCIGK